MAVALSTREVQHLVVEASAAAQRFARRLRLSPDEAADLRQDLLVDAFERLRFFDPSRGTIGAFAGTVMAHRATKAARRLKRWRDLFGLSLDEIVPDGDGATRGDLIPEADGLLAFLGQPVDAVGRVERQLDLERGLGLLDDEGRLLCAELSCRSIDGIAALGLASRSTLYRRVAEVRLALTAAGLGEA